MHANGLKSNIFSNRSDHKAIFSTFRYFSRIIARQECRCQGDLDLPQSPSRTHFAPAGKLSIAAKTD